MTNETMPWHIWLHEVQVVSGVDTAAMDPHRERLQLWYRSGEPVWMAADGLRQAHRAISREISDNSREIIRAAHRSRRLI